MSNQRGAVLDREGQVNTAEAPEPRQRALSDLLVASTGVLLQSHDLASALDTVFQNIRVALGIDLYIHHGYDEKSQDLGLVSHGGLRTEEAVVGASVRLRPGQSTSGTAAQQRAMIVVTDVQQS